MSFFKNKNILVTGGTGFVGSHLVEELVNQKANIITTHLELDPKSYFFTQKLNDKTIMVNCDVEDYELVFDIISKFNIEYIFHLAAQALVDVGYYNPKRTLTTNITGTVNILESARLLPFVKGVIFASSDKAYGKLEKVPTSSKTSLGASKYKETDPLRGDHPYEVSKSAADLICCSYFKTYNVPVVTTRFGNIYGEGDLNFSRIIPGAIKSIIKNETLNLRSNGKFVRDYLYVKDVINGYLLLAKNINKIKGEAFNFGSKETLSVIQLLKLIEKTLDKKIKYKILNNAKNEIPYQSLDYSKIKKQLNWNPKFSIKSSIKKIFEWYKNSI
jgi:CDP-glucose 4,6-dehydratase